MGAKPVSLRIKSASVNGVLVTTAGSKHRVVKQENHSLHSCISTTGLANYDRKR